MIASVFGRVYARLVAYFLPPSLYADREAGNQARMFLSSHLFGPILSTPAVLTFPVFDPTPGYDIWVLAIGLYAFWLFPFLLRLGVRYNLLVILSLLNLHFIILWNCFFYGGIASPTIVWVLVIPILSVFYIGGNRAMRPALLLTSLFSFSVFLVADTWFSPGPNDLPEAARVGLGAVSTIGTLSYVAAMSLYYARIFDAGVDLENEVQRRRRLAVELRKAVVAANDASASKSEFLARMSHELRTPLNAIIGYAQLLREEAEDTQDAALAADVDRILDAGDYLVRLINLILDLSKIEAGRMELHLAQSDLRILVRDVVERRREMIEARGNRLVTDLGRVPITVCTDGTHVRSIIDSILENAAQHTVDGTVAVRLSLLSRDGRDSFCVEIEDDGAGIDPEILPNIMETFALQRQSSGGRYGGTGLSLTVARKLCQLMGGRIDVRSRVGHGSRFAVTLPVDGEGAVPAPRPRAELPSATAA